MLRITSKNNIGVAVPRLAIQILLFACLALAACGQGASEMMEEGNQYLSEGNFQGAIVIYKTVLENAPENMDARLALGKAYLGAGKMDQAEKNFEKYVRQNPYDKSVFIDLAKLSSYRKDNKAAVDYLESYLKEFPESSEAYELLGKNYWILGDKDKARTNFEKAEEVDPEGATPKLALAQYYSAEGDQAKADTYIDAILERDPTQLEALHYHARRQLTSGDIEAYQATMQTILEHHPGDSYAKYSLGKSYLSQQNIEQAMSLASELKQQAPKTGLGQRLAGIVHYSQKEYKDAIDSLLESISIRPNVESYLYLGLSQYGAGDLETAISNLRIAADRAPKLSKAREMISLILYQQKRYSEAIAEAQKVLDVAPENMVARIIKGDAYSAQGDADNALAQLKEVTEKDPHYSDAFLKIGALHLAKGEIAEGEAAFKDAINAAPESLRPRLVLSDFYSRTDKKALARKVLQEGMQGEKRDAVLYTQLARMDLADRNPDKAKEELAKAKEADASNPAPYMMLASVSLAERKPEAALEEYDALLSQRPDFLRALLAKAVLLDTIDQHDKADAVYQEALKSDNPQAYMTYAASKRKLGDNEGALAILEKGIESNQSGELLKAKAETLFALKRFDDVLVMCDEMEKVSKKAATALRVRTFMLNKQVGKAIAAGRQLCDFAPKDPRGYILLADVYMRTKQTNEWGKILDEGVAKCGPNPDLLLELGRYYAATGDFNKALTYLDSVVRSNDRFFRAYSLRADIYAQTGRNDKAIEDYIRTLGLEQNYIPALNNLAMIYLKDSKTAPDALRLAYRAYLHAPWNPSIMDTFGYALAVNGRDDAAVSILEKAASIETDNPVVNYHLGYAYFKAGKKEQAIAKLKPVAECADCENTADAQRLLKTVQGK